MIGILDYGLGNVRAFANVYSRLNIPATAISSPSEIALAERLILPGVGHFDHAMEQLDSSGLRPALETAVGEGVPLLGVCVGMQMLAESSDEGQRLGLGWISGRVRSLRSLGLGNQISVPHMGWNDVRPFGALSSGLFKGLTEDARFYFLHSFYFAPADTDATIAHVHYGRDFACAVGRGRVFGVQFHPEKSHHWGTQLLRNFAEMAAC
jgi:imidazole glycerol-phosphate synthase subunit HisH